MHRHFAEPQLLRCLPARVPADDHAILVDHNGLAKAKALDRLRHRGDGGIVVPRVALVRFDLGQRPGLHIQFVHWIQASLPRAIRSSTIGASSKGSLQMRPPFTRQRAAGIWTGMTLVVISFMASVLAAPFLIPILQIVLLLAAIPGAICGVIAGWLRSRVGAVSAVGVLAAVYVHHNFNGNDGIRTAVEMYLLGIPTPGVMYHDTWSHLLHALVIPANFGVALVACELLGRRRRSTDPLDPPTCTVCGYDLTGNVSGRCPECGSTQPDHAQ